MAKPAPLDADVKPMNYAGFAGPRYDNDGNVLPYSILGNYNEFQQEAIRRGDLMVSGGPFYIHSWSGLRSI